MKAAVFVVLLLLVGLATWWLVSASASDPGRLIPVAFGMPSEGNIELEFGVSLLMTATEGPNLDENGRPLWDEWVKDHFELTDASGTRLDLDRSSRSRVIDALDLRSPAEFFLSARVKPTANYTVDYIPKTTEPDRYRCTFTAPSEPQKMKRRSFKAQ